MKSFLLAFGLFVGLARTAPARGATEMRARQSVLSFPRLSNSSAARFGVRLQLRDGGAAPMFERAQPLQAEVVDAAGRAVWLGGAYRQIKRAGASVVARGTLQSAAGTRFEFTDRYQMQAGAFLLSRDVRVADARAADVAFSTRFALWSARSLAMENCDFFVPGVWYRHNAGAPPRALAAQLGDRDYFFREDRLPLPLSLLRDRASGATLSLLHAGADPQSFLGDDGQKRITDARLQFGSPGIVRRGVTPQSSALGVAFWFPGTEGERTYLGGRSTENGRYAPRSHPIRAGVLHRYQLLLKLSQTPDFASAMQRSWRTAYAAYDPPIVAANLDKVYRDSMNLLNAVCQPYHGTVGLPFLLSMPDAKVPSPGALSGQMGFVGQQIPACALLLRYGLETGDAEAVKHAEAILNFWADNAATPAGTLRTWYDIQPDGSRTWRDYKMFLRVTSDGLDGALQAWRVAQRYGRNRPQWLQFARNYGDWLVKNQQPDGSWLREHDFDGTPLQRTTDTTDHPIRFLADLFCATGEARYRDAAFRAGEFCLRTVDQTGAYVGGTPDNPNALDKEGGVMALDAFLALHDLSAADDKSRWLAAAERAASFCETWTYCWNIPRPPDDPKNDFPDNRTTHGISLIATGHSGADNFMARESFDYYRLYLLTGDSHRRDFARLTMFDTKQLLDWDATLGYKYPGLQPEAMSLAVARGHSVGTWLPWLTVATLQPMTQFDDAFGSTNLNQVEARPLARLRADNARWAQTRGFAQQSERAR